ncbi:MAG: hypothetical protein JXA21_04485 [Anaerolineae bacterium]|nr:hypothetical protein [Anaerolineae bacterium]
METQKPYAAASLKTGSDLKTVARSLQARDLSRLSLPEIEAVSDLVARVVPAGNVPGVILSVLSRAPGRKPPMQTVRRDINLLLKGVEQTLDRVVYLAFFGGPAAAILAYQNLLKMVGKDPEGAFPDGTWQFYVEYALRDDTARHTNETCGFDALLTQHHVRLREVDRITAWVMTSIHCLHQYHALLENEWRERVYSHLLREVTESFPGGSPYTRLYREWCLLRPYARDNGGQSYPAYRREQFDRFLQQATLDLPGDVRQQWQSAIRAAEQEDLPAYQQQMSLLAYLEPGVYDEARVPFSVTEAHVAVVHKGRYYLIPACVPGAAQPPDVSAVRAQVAALVHKPASCPQANLVEWVQVKRGALPGLRRKLSAALTAEVNRLRFAPIVLNCDHRSRQAPLSELRQAERGVGSHALTIFDTGETLVFDQSHIFFDGAWGVGLAEILTHEASSWAVYLSSLSPAKAGRCPIALNLRWQASDLNLLRQAPHVAAEVGVESDGADLKAILTLRRLLKQRSDLLQLTVNDVLVFYRAIHAMTYQPSLDLLNELRHLVLIPAARQAASAALEALDSAQQPPPAILIPVDASQRSPRDRLYPMTFDVPLGELDVLNLHQQVTAALATYRNAGGDRGPVYAEFDRLQRAYLATLAGFGALLSKAKNIAITGQSASVGTIKLLAHMPASLQHFLDKVPGQFDGLNDLIKGREVFSNVGAVVPSSTLTRFITAKDDNEKKTLAWGVISDANGIMHITLRDFRPHVGLLIAAGQKPLALHVAQDYLNAYVQGLNDFVRDLQRIVLTSRETLLSVENLDVE